MVVKKRDTKKENKFKNEKDIRKREDEQIEQQTANKIETYHKLL